jgi:Xaa-Pro aminopeptidase
MMDHVLRQQQFERTLESERLDGFLVTHPANLRYLCGYTGSNGLLLFFRQRRTFFTDGRYTTQAREEVKGARVVIAKGSLLQAGAKLMQSPKPVRLGFEADYTTVAIADAMRKGIPKKVMLKATSALVMRQRLIKDEDELRIIRTAVVTGGEVFEKALPSIQAGIRETEVAADLELAARQAGAEGMSFETIVASGPRSALPHGRATAEPIPERGFVVVDSGVILRGYCSDMTRTVHVGRIGREQRKWYEAVLEAQLAGIAAVKPGKKAGEVDKAARHALRRCKLDKFFTHSTGHGVGLEIHEPPRLGKAQEEELRPGMVITIEPGIYVPGQGGIRIEDMVLVTADGCEVLTKVNKELIEI